jgi:hypothetical protein
MKDADESDVDCGGESACPRCDYFKTCDQPHHCVGGTSPDATFMSDCAELEVGTGMICLARCDGPMGPGTEECPDGLVCASGQQDQHNGWCFDPVGAGEFCFSNVQCPSTYSCNQNSCQLAGGGADGGIQPDAGPANGPDAGPANGADGGV